MSTEDNRLHGIVKSGKVIEFLSSADKEFEEIQWTVFGAIETNEVIVRASVGGKHFYHAAPSPLAVPVMADRRFGIDVADSALAEKLSNELWARDGAAMVALLQ
ncbi:hypothetical protein DZK25_09505 [Wenzhouxiangella sp. 15181]|nr:hypothetical protein DZK25_09505 [Wenzhouxiangella sp. 15181]RFP69110.1 hypothetical protein DZK26_04890 [Wenzhouxiangella sp. 15190]